MFYLYHLTNVYQKIIQSKRPENQRDKNYCKNILIIFLKKFAELKRKYFLCLNKNKQTKKDMTTETMKSRTEKELTKMGCSANEAKLLIEKFWNQVDYINTAKGKALYMTA